MDRATPKLPSRDFGVTARFYAQLGFTESWRDDGWMILNRGELALEFFPFADLNPSESNFSCCLRLDDMPSLYAQAAAAGIPEQCWGYPRLHPPTTEDSGLSIGYLVDNDGSLVRLTQN